MFSEARDKVVQRRPRPKYERRSYLKTASPGFAIGTQVITLLTSSHLPIGTRDTEALRWSAGRLRPVGPTALLLEAKEGVCAIVRQSRAENGTLIRNGVGQRRPHPGRGQIGGAINPVASGKSRP